MPNTPEPTLTWKHGGGLVPPPPPEDTDAAEEGTSAKSKDKPGTVRVGFDPGAAEGDRTVGIVIQSETGGAAELRRGE